MRSRSLATVAFTSLAGCAGVVAALGFDSGADKPARASQTGLRAASTGPVTRLPGDAVVGLAQSPSGSLLAVAVDDTSQGRQSSTLSSIPQGGARATTSTIVRRPTGSARASSMTAGVSAAGAVAAWNRGTRGGASGQSLVVTTVAPDGRRISDETVQGLKDGAYPFAVAIGPTGAVGLIAISTGADGPVATVSFRPAGASSFGAPVRLSQASIPSADGSLNSDQPGSVVQLAMAPSGGAAIVDGPVGSLRRVAPDGAVSDERWLGDAFADQTLAVFRADDTLAAASARLIENTSRRAGEPPYTSRIVLAEWPAAEPKPTVRTLPPQPESTALTLAVGPHGRTAVTIADGDAHLIVLAGTGLAVEPLARFPTQGNAYGVHTFLGSDGSTTLLWVRDGTDTAPLTATAARGAAFTRPRATVRSVPGGALIGAASALPDGRLAIGYSDGDHHPHVLVAQP